MSFAAFKSRQGSVFIPLVNVEDFVGIGITDIHRTVGFQCLTQTAALFYQPRKHPRAIFQVEFGVFLLFVGCAIGEAGSVFTKEFGSHAVARHYLHQPNRAASRISLGIASALLPDQRGDQIRI